MITNEHRKFVTHELNSFLSGMMGSMDTIKISLHDKEFCGNLLDAITKSCDELISKGNMLFADIKNGSEVDE